MNKTKNIWLRKRGMKLRFAAMQKGLTATAIAQTMGCSTDLISKTFLGTRTGSFHRIKNFIHKY